MADPRDTDPADRDPRERDLGRRSHGPAVSPWLVIGVILLLGVAAAALAFALYELGHLINRTIEAFLD
jgi:hypothetical protein